MARTALARAITALLAVAALAACNGADGDRAAPDADAAASVTSTTATRRPETTTTRPCVAGDLDPRVLGPLVVEDVPGFEQQPDEVGGTGPSDLSKAVVDDGQPDAEPALQGDGFRAGYQRLWANAAGEELVLFLYEFCQPDGAERYAGRIPRIFRRMGVPTEQVAGRVADGGFTAVEGTSRGLWAWRTADTSLLLVIAFSDQAPDPTPLLERAEHLLSAQLDRLVDLAASVA